MRPLNIVQIFYVRPHLGGSGIMSMNAAKELAKRGHNIYIVSYPGTYLTEEEKQLGIKLYPVEKIDYPCFKSEPYNATLASQIVNIYEKEGVNIDIIHANYAITHGEAALTAQRIINRKGGNAKVIITNHGSDIHTNGHHSLLGPTIKDLIESADATTYVSKSLQQEAKKLFQLGNCGKVIYNFVDEKKFNKVNKNVKNKMRSLLNLPKDKIIIYHASNFRPVKQTKLLIEAAIKLKREGENNIHFLLVGDGPEKKTLEEQTKNFQDINVSFTGRQEDVLPYILASDIGILPSKRESFGLALLEPMACGLPVLGSNIGGIPEVITHGKTGYVFESNNVDEIVYYIKKLAKDINLREELGEASRKKAISVFSRKTIIDSYERLYTRLLV